jgi:hypothetical protein
MAKQRIIEAHEVEWYRITLADDSMGPTWRKGDRVDVVSAPGRTPEVGDVCYVKRTNGRAWFVRLIGKTDEVFEFAADETPDRFFRLMPSDIALMAIAVGVSVPVEEIGEDGTRRRAGYKAGRNRPTDSGKLGGNLIQRGMVPAFAC